MVDIEDVLFTNNESDRDGGGIYTWSSDLTVTASQFTGNSADGGGGGIETSGRVAADPGAYPRGVTRIIASTFTGNTAESGGAVHNSRDSRTMIKDSTLNDNTAAYGGGAASVGSTQLPEALLKIYNSTISGNTATVAGGGVYNSRSAVKMINATIAFNEALNGGGFTIRPPASFASAIRLSPAMTPRQTTTSPDSSNRSVPT